MPLTLTIPPSVARDVNAYVSRRGMTIDAFVLEFLTRTASIERRTQKRKNPVLKFCGVLAKGSADKMLSAVAEQRTIDNDIWIAASTFECDGVLITNDHHLLNIPQLRTITY